MKENKKAKIVPNRGKTEKKKVRLTIEELEKRIAPSTINKKRPVPPPYAPGTDYGLIRRDNLSW